MYFNTKNYLKNNCNHTVKYSHADNLLAPLNYFVSCFVFLFLKLFLKKLKNTYFKLIFFIFKNYFNMVISKIIFLKIKKILF